MKNVRQIKQVNISSKYNFNNMKPTWLKLARLVWLTSGLPDDLGSLNADVILHWLSTNNILIGIETFMMLNKYGQIEYLI